MESRKMEPKNWAAVPLPAGTGIKQTAFRLPAGRGLIRKDLS